MAPALRGSVTDTTALDSTTYGCFCISTDGNYEQNRHPQFVYLAVGDAECTTGELGIVSVEQDGFLEPVGRLDTPSKQSTRSTRELCATLTDRLMRVD